MTSPAFFAALSAAGWTDAAAFGLLGLSVLVGAVRGLTGQAARLFGFVSGLSAAALLHAPLRANAFPGGTGADAALALAGALVGGAAVALAVRWFVRRFLRLLVGQPADAVLGAALSGAACALALLLAFSAARLVPSDAVRRTVFEESVSGRFAAPFADRLVGAAAAPARP